MIGLLATLGLALAAADPTAQAVWTGPGVTLLGTPSRDGKLVSCVLPGSGDLAIYRTADRSIQRLTHLPRGSKEFAYFSAISPDSKQVAFAWMNEAGFYDLRVTGVEASRPRVLFRNEEAGFVQPSAWTPDGKHVLTLFFRKDNISQIALVNAEDGAVKVLKSLNWVYPKKMDISPDGRWIVYDSFARENQSQRDIYVLAVDGASETRLIAHPAEDVFPLWTPDGRGVVFASDRNGTTDAWLMPVNNGKPDGEPRLLRRDLSRFLPMGVTAAGYLIYGVRGGTTDIWTAPALIPGERVNAEKLTSRYAGAISAPAWSRDGTKLAYLARHGAENFGTQSRIVIVRDAVSGAERELAPKLAHMERLRWSPDGKWLLVSGSDGKGRAGLFRVSSADGAVKPVLWDEAASFRGLPGDWIDDRTIVYGGESVRRRDLDTGAEAVIAPVPAKVVRALPGGKVLHKNEEFDCREGIIVDASSLHLPEYDGGPISLHPQRNGVAYTRGGTHNEVWSLKLP